MMMIESSRENEGRRTKYSRANRVKNNKTNNNNIYYGRNFSNRFSVVFVSSRGEINFIQISAERFMMKITFK